MGVVITNLSCRSNNPTTTIQFYQTWGRPFGLASQCPAHPQFCEYESMQAALTTSYSTFACMNKPATVAPVGEAFHFVKQTQGDDAFHRLYNTGGVSDHHPRSPIPTRTLLIPSLEGSYLSALLHFLALFHTSVVGNSETMGLEEATVRMLQEAAEVTWAEGLPWTFPQDSSCDLCICHC